MTLSLPKLTIMECSIARKKSIQPSVNYFYQVVEMMIQNWTKYMGEFLNHKYWKVATFAILQFSYNNFRNFFFCAFI